MMQRKIDIDQSQPLINEERKIYLTPRRILRSSSLSSSGNNTIAMRHRILIISSLFAFLLFVHIIIFSNVKLYNHNIQVEGWAKNVSRDTVEYVLPNENTTRIEPSTLCTSNSEPMFLLIVVCSSASNFEHRQTIRETWGNTTQFNYPYFEKFHGGANNNSYLNINYKQWKKYEETLNSSSERPVSLTNFRVKVVFLVGISPHDTSDEQQYEINYENDAYGDIIQENFLDSYNNLTLKSILLLKWVTNNCIDKVKYIMKCDDDTFINVPNLLHVLLGGTIPLYKSTISYHDKSSILVTKSKNRLPDTKNLLMGYKFCNAKKIQDVTSKWYAPSYMFDGEYYPDYLSGTAYIFTFDTARALYEESLKTQVFHLEDVYLTGFVAERIKMRRTHHPLFFYQYIHKDKCSLRGMISQHQITPMEMTEAYNFVTNLTIQCAVPEKNFSTTKLVLAQRKRCH